MWTVEKDENGSWVAAYDDEWLPNTYQSREEALEALVEDLVERLD